MAASCTRWRPAAPAYSSPAQRAGRWTSQRRWRRPAPLQRRRSLCVEASSKRCISYLASCISYPTAMRRIGVFICHCGLNIAGTVDVEQAARMVRGLAGVAQATTYRYMCSDPGQSLIRDAIKKDKLDGIVVAACSPAMHEVTFRRAVAAAGLNPYRCEVANIREQCSWVHQGERDAATLKAADIVASLIEK